MTTTTVTVAIEDNLVYIVVYSTAQLLHQYKSET